MDERVQKLIAQSGLCSRRKAEELIEQGKVKVNGKTITLGDKAKASDTILVNNEPIQKEKTVYYMLNKPKRYITTSDDMFNRKKVLDLLPKKPRVFAVGRLDRDATGLLLLTNDGDFANKVMHPSNGVGKTYIAVLDAPFRKEDAQKAKKGMLIDRSMVRATIIQLDKYTVAVTVHVGVHKVVKRLCKSLGYMVKHLHRTHIGSLAVDVNDGEWRHLTKEDMQKVFTKQTITKKTFLEE
ncbi:pseudouridine synthase [Candidatus Woesearchaeota archaeon]|nr:pseudouridine synthase [Candidatus Woesearchaeota archaeon]